MLSADGLFLYYLHRFVSVEGALVVLSHLGARAEDDFNIYNMRRLK